MMALIQTFVLCIALAGTFATEFCVKLTVSEADQVYNTRRIVCKMNPLCGLYDPTLFAASQVEIYEERNGKTEVLASCSSGSNTVLSTRGKDVVNDVIANYQWNNKLSFGLVVKGSADDVRYKCSVKEVYPYRVFESSYSVIGKPVYTSKEPVYSTERPVYTARNPEYPTEKSVYTTREPGYPTARPVYTTKSPEYQTEKPVYTTREPGYPTARPVYTPRPAGYQTDRPVYTPRDPGYQTDRPVYTPRDPGYQTERPVYTPRDPGYQTDRPVYTPRDPGYQTDRPVYTPRDPGYQTDRPVYTPRDPGYQTDRPVYTHRDPGYQTDRPVYTPRDQGNQTDRPVYTPRDPGYQTDIPVYTPRDPGYQTDRPVYTPRDPGSPIDKPVNTPRYPGYQTDRPVYTPRDPGYQTDRPVYTPRDPGYQTDRPVYTPRDPGYQTDRPVYTSRVPGYQTDRPIYTSRDSGYKTDRPVYTPRDPGYQTDRPVNTPRDPGYQTDRPVYTPRDPGYQTDRPVYTPRDPGYQTDRLVYTSRVPGYQTDRPVYTSRDPGYETDRPVYTTINMNYITNNKEIKQCVSLSTNIQQTNHFIIDCNANTCSDLTQGKLVSLQLTRTYGGTETPVSKIDKIQGYAVPLEIKDPAKNFKVSGRLNDGEGGYLRSEWDGLDEYDSGIYKCSLIYIDAQGKFITVTDSRKIETGNDFIGNLILDIDNPWPTMPGESGMIYTSEKPYGEDGENCNEDLKAYQDNVIDYFFYEAASIGNKTYHLSKEPFASDVKSDDLCRVIVGGYLAEMDDAQEYDAVAKYLREHEVRGALIGGTNEENVEVWKFRRSGRQVPYFRWRKGEPSNTDGKEHCLSIWTYFSDLMNDTQCGGSGFKFHFVCETDM